MVSACAETSVFGPQTRSLVVLQLPDQGQDSHLHPSDPQAFRPGLKFRASFPGSSGRQQTAGLLGLLTNDQFPH